MRDVVVPRRRLIVKLKYRNTPASRYPPGNIVIPRKRTYDTAMAPKSPSSAVLKLRDDTEFSIDDVETIPHDDPSLLYGFATPKPWVDVPKYLTSSCMAAVDPAAAPKDEKCIICHDCLRHHDPPALAKLRACGHIFGEQCIIEALEACGCQLLRCPMCRNSVWGSGGWFRGTWLQFWTLRGLDALQRALWKREYPPPNNHWVLEDLISVPEGPAPAMNPWELEDIDAARLRLIAQNSTAWRPTPSYPVVIRQAAMRRTLRVLMYHYRYVDKAYVSPAFTSPAVLERVDAILEKLNGAVVPSHNLFAALLRAAEPEPPEHLRTEWTDDTFTLASLGIAWEAYYNATYPRLGGIEAAIAPIRTRSPVAQFGEYWEELLAVFVEVRIEAEEENKTLVANRDRRSHRIASWRNLAESAAFWYFTCWLESRVHLGLIQRFGFVGALALCVYLYALRLLVERLVWTGWPEVALELRATWWALKEELKAVWLAVAILVVVVVMALDL